MNEDFLAAVAAKRGKAVDALEQKPEITPDIGWYLDTFFMLSNSRQMGFSGAGPLPLSEITNYTRFFEIITDDVKEFCTIIVRMDNTYLKHVQDKNASGGTSHK